MVQKLLPELDCIAVIILYVEVGLATGQFQGMVDLQFDLLSLMIRNPIVGNNLGRTAA